MNNRENSGIAGDADERYAEELVDRLNSLQEGERIAAQLMACGPVAIPPLRHLLLLGRRSVVYQPRRWAVEVLGVLGAKDVLIEYLNGNPSIPDPAVRMAEEAVENAAAHELLRWRTGDVRDVLLHFAIPHARSGIVEALGQFRWAEAIPYFLHALEDDICRSAAEEALRALGRTAEIALVAAVRTKLPSSEEERPSSRRRRTTALELLAELAPSKECWPLLKPLLEERDAGIVTASAKIVATLGGHEDKIAAVDRLLGVLPAADWFLRAEIQDRLVSLYREAQPRIEQEIADRSAQPLAEQVADSSLRTLLAVQRRVEQSPVRGPTE